MDELTIGKLLVLIWFLIWCLCLAMFLFLR